MPDKLTSRFSQFSTFLERVRAPCINRVWNKGAVIAIIAAKIVALTGFQMVATIVEKEKRARGMLV